MFVDSRTVAVNPPGASPVLTHAQLWEGLLLKVEDPVSFVSGMEASRILGRRDDGLVREVVVRGRIFKELITFTEPVQIRYERIEGREIGWIMNTLSEGPGGLLLTYTIALAFPDAMPGTPEEEREAAEMGVKYAEAVEITLDLIRRMAQEGRLKA